MGVTLVPDDLPLHSRAGERPLKRLDLEPIGPPRLRHCAWCCARLAPGQNETCSPDCRREYDSFIRTLGIAMAKRMILQAMYRNRKPMPARAKRAYAETTRLARHAASWLRNHWKDMEEERAHREWRANQEDKDG